MGELDENSTAHLVEELAKRKGVQQICVKPYESYAIDLPGFKQSGTGPVILFVVVD